MKKHTFLRAVLTALLAVLFVLTPLSACKRSDSGSSTAKYDHVYKQTSIELPEEMTNVDTLYYRDGTLYALGSAYEDVSDAKPDEDGVKPVQMTLMLCTVGTDGTQGKPQKLATPPEGSYISSTMLNPDLTISYLLNEYTYDEKTDNYEDRYTYKKVDLEGSEQASVPLFTNNNDTENAMYPQYFVGDNDGNFYLASNNQIFAYDSNATQLYSISVTGYINRLTKGPDGKVLVFWQEENETKMRIQALDNAAKQLGKEYEVGDEVSNYTYNMFGGDDGNLYYDNSSSLMQYDLSSKKSTELVNWINSDLNISDVDASRVAIASEKELYLVSNSYHDDAGKTEIIRLDWVDPKELKEKSILTLAASYINYDIQMAVVNFNKTNDRYRITVKDYSTYNTEEDYDRATTMLNNDIASGNIPDILLVSSDMPFDSYSAKGLFADLNQYLNADSDIKREDYLENMLAATTVDGKLYSIIPSFGIYTIAGKSKYVGTEPGWTMDDLNALIDKLPKDARLFYDMTRDNLLQLACTMTKNDFIDSQTGKCSFDSPEFVKLLEFTNTFSNESIWDSVDWDNVDESFWKDMETACRDDRAYLQSTSIYSFDDYWQLKKVTFGDDITLVGYPSASKQGSLITSSLELAMSAKSKNPDGAWQFIKYFLGDEYQSALSYQWPIKRSQIDKLAENAMKEPESSDETIIGSAASKVETAEAAGMGNIGQIDQQSVDALKTFIESVSQVMRYDRSVLDIIKEEASAYYAGKKSADETAKIIQNRVQIYVSENR